MAKTEKALQALGLSTYESTVYLGLIERGRSNISEIAAQADVHRMFVYAALKNLQQRGLVSVIHIGKRKQYAAEHPKNLNQILENLQVSLQDALPTLVSRFEASVSRSLCRQFLGKTGLREVYNDLLHSLKKDDVFFRFESPKDYVLQDAYLPKEYFERICKKREIQKYVITNEETHARKPKQLERYVHVIPKQLDRFDYNVTQIIYANKIAFINFDRQIAWIIEDEAVATFHRQAFKMLMRSL